MDEKYEKSIDEQIRRAMEEGKFSNLPGKGKPLDLSENPHADPGWRTAYHMLRSSGYTLPWIEARRSIEADLDAARKTVRRTWNWYSQPGQPDEDPAWRAAQWDQARVRFEEQIAALNKRIFALNLEVPGVQFKLKPLQAGRELIKITSSAD